MNRAAHIQRLVLRYVFFILGVAINSFGVALITKAALGTSPITSVSYVLDLAFAPSLGTFTFMINLGFIALQIGLLRRDFKPIQLLQLVVNLAFSIMIDVSMVGLGWFEPQSMIVRICALLVGCAVLGAGIAIEVAPNVIVVPGEGAVRALAAVSERPFGTCKVVFDASLVGIALVLSLIFFRTVQGLGLGTLVSALLVGRIVNILNQHLPFLSSIASLSRSQTGVPEPEL